MTDEAKPAPYAIGIVEGDKVVPYTYEVGVGVRALTPDEHAEWAKGRPRRDIIPVRELCMAMRIDRTKPSRFVYSFVPKKDEPGEDE